MLCEQQKILPLTGLQTLHLKCWTYILVAAKNCWLAAGTCTTTGLHTLRSGSQKQIQWALGSWSWLHRTQSISVHTLPAVVQCSVVYVEWGLFLGFHRSNYRSHGLENTGSFIFHFNFSWDMRADKEEGMKGHTQRIIHEMTKCCLINKKVEFGKRQTVKNTIADFETSSFLSHRRHSCLSTYLSLSLSSLSSLSHYLSISPHFCLKKNLIPPKENDNLFKTSTIKLASELTALVLTE